jgi:long-chain acyl-CoA synthetase
LGKLKRAEIRDRYLDELLKPGLREKEGEVPLRDEDLKILSSEIGRGVSEVLAKEGKLKRQVRLDDHLELDLGLDSLGRVEVMAAIEKILKLDIPEASMAKVFTVREFILEIEKLLLDKKLQDKEVLPAKIETLLWSDILKTKPAKEIIRKIDLSPVWMARVFTEFGSLLLYITVKIIWQLKAWGRKDLPCNEAFILCSNHVSFLDAFLIAASLPAGFKKHTFFVGLRGYFEVPLIRNLVKSIRVIPIDPNLRLVEAMQACAYVLRSGKVVCIFPEGGRSIDGEVKEFKKGVGILAKELGVRLLPVYICGAYAAWPRTKRFPKPHPITVVFGKPHHPEELRRQGIRLGAKDDYEAVASGIREEVMRLKERI